MEIHIGRHRALQKQPSGLVMCKQRQDDYTTRKVYRCVALLGGMGNGVEKVVVEILSS